MGVTSATSPPSSYPMREDKQLPHRPSTVSNETEGQRSRTNLQSRSGGSSSLFIVSAAPLSAAAHEGEVSGIPEPTPVVRHSNTSAHTLEDLPEESPGATNGVTEEVNLPTGDHTPKSPGSPEVVTSPLLDSPRSTSPSKNKYLPPIPKDFAENGGTVKSKASWTAPDSSPPGPASGPTVGIDDLFEMTGRSELVVRFEIVIVKVLSEPISSRMSLNFSTQVPWLPLHGIQFRRVGGDGWQYQMLARRVLTELKL